MGASDVLPELVAGLFGAGGLVALFKAIVDWREGREQKEQDVTERHVLRLDKRVAFLEKERERDVRYQSDLIRALAKAGLDVPERRP